MTLTAAPVLYCFFYYIYGLLRGWWQLECAKQLYRITYYCCKTRYPTNCMCCNILYSDDDDDDECRRISTNCIDTLRTPFFFLYSIYCYYTYMFLSSPCNPVGTYNMYNIIHAHARRILYNTLYYNRTDKRTAEGVYSSSTPSRSDGTGRNPLHPTPLLKLLVREVRLNYQYLYNIYYPTNIVCMCERERPSGSV